MEKSRHFRGVLFDLDGTLIEFKFPVRESRLAMFDFLKRNGYLTDNFKDNMRTQDLLDDAEAQWAKSETLREEHAFSDIRESLFKILDDFEFESVRSSRPLPGCLDTIEKIGASNITMGIVTNSGRAPVSSILSDYGFLPHMKVVITRDEMSRMKPSPDGLLSAMKSLNVSRDEILYVGDSVLDVEAARNARVRCASIPSGSYPAETLRSLSPDFMLNSMSDLEDLLFANRR